MRKLGIVHISDAHLQKKDIEEIKKIIEKLIEDVRKVASETDQIPNLICFTGDLIQRGDYAKEVENEWKLANEIIVAPIWEQLNVEKDNFIIVPGNHEVNRNEIEKYSEKGFMGITNRQEIDDLVKEMPMVAKGRIQYFYEYIKEYYADKVDFGKIGYSLIREFNGIKIGIACVDSAWRSSGEGDIERNRIIVGKRQIEELFDNIKETDLKVCLMHHPINWLVVDEQQEIKRCLGKFDLVLRGHVHELDDEQIISKGYQTIYSTAGKIFPMDYYNGYSYIVCDLEKRKCQIYLRKYYDVPRECFDKAVELYEDGKVEYDLLSHDKTQEELFGLATQLQKSYVGLSEKFLAIQEFDKKTPDRIEDLYVTPVLSTKSEYVKEEMSEEVDIEDLISSYKNIIFIGKRESGKTTILQKIAFSGLREFDKSQRVPIYIDLKTLPKGTDRILQACFQFVLRNVSEDYDINKNTIRNLIEKGFVRILVDNVCLKNQNDIIKLQDFIKTYPQCKYVLMVEEEFFQTISLKELPDFGLDFDNIYIQMFGKKEIRELTDKWYNGRMQDTTELVERIYTYCNSMNFPRTPFNIALFLVISDVDSSFVPINESNVMQNYLETVLEKLSTSELDYSAYDFKLKEDFLTFLAYEMYRRNTYYFTYEEFCKLSADYHERLGFKETESKFNSIFFEKCILAQYDNFVSFRHHSIMEFFLAKKAEESSEFLEEILTKGKRHHFQNEIKFYAGLNRNCKKILSDISEEICQFIYDNMEVIDALNGLKIQTQFNISKDQLLQNVQKNRLTQSEIDEITDKSHIKNTSEVTPQELSKIDTIDDSENYFTLLNIYGSILKNSELINNNEKIMHLETYIYGYSLMFAVLIKQLEETNNEYITMDNLDELALSKMGIETEEDLEHFKTTINDFMKIGFPLAIQAVIVENVGNPKLEIAINETISRNKSNEFIVFMMTLLKSDLRIGNIKSIISNYTKQVQNTDILKIVLFKMIFYYRSRYFGNDGAIDAKLLEIIVDLEIELNPNIDKGQKAFVTKLMRGKLKRDI